jgi:hypothetical protein
MSKEYASNYYNNNKIKYSTIYNKTYSCEMCDCIFTKSYMARHVKTRKHIKNMNNESLKKISMEEVSDAVKEKRIEVKVLLKERE